MGYFSHNVMVKSFCQLYWLCEVSYIFLPFPEMVTVSTSPRPSSMDSSVNIETETDYLKIAKKGGGHKG